MDSPVRKKQTFIKRPLDDAVRRSAMRRIPKQKSGGLFSPTAKLDTSQVRDVRSKVVGKKMTRDELKRRVQELLNEKKFKDNRDANRTGR